MKTLKKLLNIMNNSDKIIPTEFYIWEGVFKTFTKAKLSAEGFGFAGETYSSKSYDAAKECLTFLENNIPIPFFHKQRSVILPPVVSMILNTKDKINILDFGGGLGIGYMTLKESIINVKEKIKYTIIELQEVCNQGIYLHNEEIIFNNSIPKEVKYDLVHSASAIQYIEDWKSIIEIFCSLSAEYILLSDVFVGEFDTFVTLQNYYGNKIPHWFFNFNEFITVFNQNGYTLEMRTYVSSKRLNIEDELPMNNFEIHNRLKYTSHLLFSKIK